MKFVKKDQAQGEKMNRLRHEEMEMNPPGETLFVGQRMRLRLIEMLKAQPEIFSFEDEPHLASLCTCLGLQAEIGQGDLDRLSVPLGVTLSDYQENPWESSIIKAGNQYGIVLDIPSIKEFPLRHEDFLNILHPFSMTSDGRLGRIVIFPYQVYEKYKELGLELVIVRDWILSSSLSTGPKVNYIKTNQWEVENNTALVQAELMANRQVAFSGTHDVSDHLLGGRGDLFSRSMSLYKQVRLRLNQVFYENKKPKNIELVLSYLIGVLLDDMAQPRWYGSDPHGKLILMTLDRLESVSKSKEEIGSIFLPASFDKMIHHLRNETELFVVTSGNFFEEFFNDLSTVPEFLNNNIK